MLEALLLLAVAAAAAYGLAEPRVSFRHEVSGVGGLVGVVTGALSFRSPAIVREPGRRPRLAVARRNVQFGFYTWSDRTAPRPAAPADLEP